MPEFEDLSLGSMNEWTKEQRSDFLRVPQGNTLKYLSHRGMVISWWFVVS